MKVGFLTHAEGAHMSAYFPALAAAKDCDEVVLADPDSRWKDAAKKALGDKLTHVYTDHFELLAQESPKLCMVSMEAKHAPPVIEAALESGAHIFSEKPGCVALDQFESLAQLAESKHLHLMLAFANRSKDWSFAARRFLHLSCTSIGNKQHSGIMVLCVAETQKAELAQAIAAIAGQDVKQIMRVTQTLKIPFIQIFRPFILREPLI